MQLASPELMLVGRLGRAGGSRSSLFRAYRNFPDNESRFDQYTSLPILSSSAFWSSCFSFDLPTDPLWRRLLLNASNHRSLPNRLMKTPPRLHQPCVGGLAIL